MRIRRELLGALCALVVTACAAASASPDDGADAPRSSTVSGVGELPEPVATATGVTTGAVDSSTTSPESSTTSTTVGETTTTTEFHADGNRILLIGDSILASTSKRYSNDSCNALVPLGWQVEVEAEVSRGVQWGNDVLAARLKAGWDAAVVFLGSNNPSGGNEYLKALNQIITKLAPLPVVLVTASNFRPEMQDINHTIRAMVDVYPDRVSIVDWEQITSERPELLNTDGIHPTPEGRTVLAQAIADHVGPAPSGTGRCLDSVFTDDSAGNVETGATTPPSHGGTQTTVKPSTSTTLKPGSTSTTVKPSTSTTSPGGVSTSSPVTVATVVVTVGTTSPPGTQPPITQPPAQPPTQSTP
jgi:lysophospholipase L1-like esterase